MADSTMIDDAFWLQYAADHAKAAVSERDAAAGKIDTYLGIVWAIYTGVFTAGIAFHQITASTDLIVLMLSPVIIIPVARFLCLNVQLPPRVEFRENIPADIEANLYDRVLEKKSSKLNIARAAALISVISIVVSIFAFDLSHSKRIYSVEAKYDSTSKSFLVYGISDASKALNVSLAGASDTGGKTMVYIEGTSVKSNPDGLFSFVVPSDKIKSNLKVFISWTDATSQAVIIKN
jgi:hypothetical protein